MKTNYSFLLLMLLIATSVFSQVGIGTTMPDSQLDIRSSNQITPANTDGILIPKIDAFPLTNPTVAQQSMLVYLTTATTFGGNPKPIGFYYWNNTPADWIGISSSANGDHDWYEEGTTVAPNAITDEMFHTGNVAIGKNTTSFPLEIENTTYDTTLNSTSSFNTSNSILKYGHRNTITGNSTDGTFGIENSIIKTGTGAITGTLNTLNNPNSTSIVGTNNNVTTSFTGNSNGTINSVLSYDGTATAVDNTLNSSGTGVSTGINNTINSVGTGIQYGVKNSLNNTGLNSKYGVFTDLIGASSLNQFGMQNNISVGGDGVKYGVYNNMISTTGNGNAIGTNNTISAAGNGDKIGVENTITSNGTENQYGVKNSLTGTGSSTKYGVRNDFTSNGTSINYGSYTSITGNSNGDQRGIVNTISNTGSGNHYGTHNILNSVGSGTGNHIGTYNVISGSSTGNSFGNYSEVSTNTNANIFGNSSYINSAGTGIKYGTSVLINPGSGGTHYGIHSEVLKAGATNFAGYFLGNLGIGTTAANTYTLPASRGTVGQTMRTDGVGNVTWANNSDFAWSLNGNSALATNFIGTTNAQPFRMFTSNIERMNIAATGNVGINIAPSTYKLDVASGTGDAIFGHSTNVGGVLGYETNFVVGTAGTILGAGVYASNPTAGYTSSFAQSTGAATVAANINFSSVWIANYNLVDNASATANPSASYSQLNVTNATLSSGIFQNAIYGYSNRGTTAGNPDYTVGVNGLANAQNQDAMGVVGRSFSNTSLSVGGYFEGNTYAGVLQGYAYVGGNIGSSTKITGLGAVAEIIPTENHGRITVICPESPEYWYQDYGTVEMVNGKATIVLDEILADIIVVDDDNPIRVICTPVGMPYFNGITIMSQTTNSVEILELNGGNHSGKLQYQIVVKPKTNYGEGRFHQAPGPAYLKADKEPLAAKAKNQSNDGRKIFKWPSDAEVYKYNPEDLVGIGELIPGGPNAGKIKLGNGKYGVGLPPENPQVKR